MEAVGYVCPTAFYIEEDIYTGRLTMTPVKPDAAVLVEHISKTFHQGEAGSFIGRLRGQHPAREVQALRDVSFQVARGEIFGILGPNGSGKSTLIRVLSTLIIPDTGRALVFGHDVVKEDMVVKRLINRVSVEASFFKKLSPIENLMYGARLYGLTGKEARERILDILRRLGLRESSFDQPMEEMSRGMQQKVAIARAFLTSPILLLLDEPTTGLDPRSKKEVQQLILSLRDQHDATIILCTHDMEEAESLCDRIAILDEGRIVALDTPDGLKRLVGGPSVSMEDVFLALTGKHLDEEGEAVAPTQPA